MTFNAHVRARETNASLGQFSRLWAALPQMDGPLRRGDAYAKEPDEAERDFIQASLDTLASTGRWVHSDLAAVARTGY